MEEGGSMDKGGVGVTDGVGVGVKDEGGVTEEGGGMGEGGVMNEGVSTEPKWTLRSVSLTRGASRMIQNKGGIGIMDEPRS